MKKAKRIIALTLLISILLGFTTIFTACNNSDSDGDGGSCRICGTHTNWTYKGGGYVCYSCDKKYY